MVLAAIVALGVPPAAVIAATALIFAINLWQHVNLSMPAALRPIDRLLVTPDLHRPTIASIPCTTDRTSG